MQTTKIKFPSGNTLVLHSMAVVLLYTIAYDAVIVDQNGQQCLPFWAFSGIIDSMIKRDGTMVNEYFCTMWTGCNTKGLIYE